MNDRYWKYSTAHAFLGAGDFHEMTQQCRIIVLNSDAEASSRFFHNLMRFTFTDALHRAKPTISEESVRKEWADFVASFDTRPKMMAVDVGIDLSMEVSEQLGAELKTWVSKPIKVEFDFDEIQRIMEQAKINLAEPESEYDPKAHVCKREECSCSFGRPDAITEKVLVGDSNARLARSLAEMIIEWVDGGIKGGTDWRNGLESVILSRIQRLANSEAYFKGLDAVENNHVFDWVILEFYPVTTQALFKNPFRATEAQAKSVFKETCFCASIPDRSSIHVLVQNCGVEHGGWKIALIEGIIETYQLVDKLVDRITHWVEAEATPPTPKTESGEFMYAFAQYSVPNNTVKFSAAFPEHADKIDAVFKRKCNETRKFPGDVMLLLTLHNLGNWVVVQREPMSGSRISDYAVDPGLFETHLDEWVRHGCTVNSFGTVVRK